MDMNGGAGKNRSGMTRSDQRAPGRNSTWPLRQIRIGFWVLAAVLALAVALPASANHVEQPRNGLDEVGFHPFGNAGFNTDVFPWVSPAGELHAAVGTWGTLAILGAPPEGDPCPSDVDPITEKSGVKIVNASDPASPTLAARIATIPESQNNDVKVNRLLTNGAAGEFEGHDILAHSLEPCGAEGILAQIPGVPVSDIPTEQTGFQLYDVTDPSSPVKLGTYNNGGLGVHNLYMFNRPDLGRSFVAAVFTEINQIDEPFIRSELQIVDITNPAGDLLGKLGPPVGVWELVDAQAQGGPTFEELCQERGTHFPGCLLHDVWVSEDSKTAYASWWDAGLILLDITDPEDPQFVGQIQSGGPADEGNTHAAVPFTLNGRNLVIVGDEDFVGPGEAPHVTINEAPSGSDVAAGEQFLGSEFTNTRPLADGAVGPLPAIKADDEFGCVWTTGQAFGQAFGDWIGVARRGGEVCPAFQQKVSAAEISGASGLIVANNAPGSTAGTAAGSIPAMMIPQNEGDRLMNSIDNLDPDAVVVTMELLPAQTIDPWGFMRVIDVTDPDPANWSEVSQFKAPHVDEVAGSQDVFSAHNPVVGPDGRVYFSWYTDGVRVLEPVGLDGDFQEFAWFAPRPTDHATDNDSDPHGVQSDNIGFWGSWPICDPAMDRLLVFNSDLNRGLYILTAQFDDNGACDFVEPPPPQGGGKATGGGWLEDLSGQKINFGFNVKEKATGFHGNLQLNDKAAQVKIHISAITALGEVTDACGAISPGRNALEFHGAGTFNGEPGARFRVCVEDNAEPGSSASSPTPDQFHLECLAGCGYNLASRVSDEAIDGGNIQVHKAAAEPSSGGEASTLILDPLLMTDGVAGQVQVFTVTVFDANQDPAASVAVSLQRTAADGSINTLTAVSDLTGAAVFSMVSLDQPAEYRATASGVESNVIELTPVLQ